MNAITSTLIAAVFGGFFSIVPSTLYAPSAAQDSTVTAYSEGNFVGTAKLDNTQVEFAAKPKWLCFNDMDSPSNVICYRAGEVPYPSVDAADLIWVGDGDSTHPYLPKPEDLNR